MTIALIQHENEAIRVLNDWAAARITNVSGKLAIRYFVVALSLFFRSLRMVCIAQSATGGQAAVFSMRECGPGQGCRGMGMSGATSASGGLGETVDQGASFKSINKRTPCI
jgi:hypothetical protein